MVFFWGFLNHMVDEYSDILEEHAAYNVKVPESNPGVSWSEWEVMCHLHGEGGEYLANQSSGSGIEQG
jgi:hypothetical protein